MKNETLADLKAALASRLQVPVLTYYEERLLEVQKELVSCTKENFQQYQGRALEIMKMIEIIKSVK